MAQAGSIVASGFISVGTSARRTAAPCAATTSCRVPARTACRQHARLQSSTATRAAVIDVEATTVGSVESLGPDLWNKTYYPTAFDASNERKPWFIVDAEGQTLGRLAVLVANHIRGKNLPTYTPSMDMGAFVIVINAEKVQVTGKKYDQKMYYNQGVNGRPGSMKTESFKHLQARIPERIVERAVRGMLPKGRLGNDLFNHLKVFKGTKHPHQAQRPTDITPQINQKPQVSA
ncbi:hypothetical protein WJX72_008015 [[Myrmecia] bisecta]|uniref:50S ribosomal protein L13, chloroplastic n=1 Tax=[Myrmecia] bisecta TaxID=41462 RepID=A0AAW1R8C0_9CHLO